jgi:hypothetical protein
VENVPFNNSTRRTDMYRPARRFWVLVAVGAAVAVGLTTHDAAFIVITFLGTLWLPRLLGLTPRRGPGFGWHGGGWGGRCQGAERKGSDAPTSGSAPQSV